MSMRTNQPSVLRSGHAYLVLCALMASAAVGCKSSDFSGGPAACTPNTSQICSCAGGARSTQVCSADGTSYTECQCGAAGSGVQAGVSGGVAGASGGVAGVSAGMAAAGSGAAGMGAAGTQGGAGAAAGTGGQDSDAGTDAAVGGDGETGRLIGITAAHNAVRAAVTDPTPSPALPPLTWSTDIAAKAQAYAEELAADCSGLAHSGTPGLGENLAAFGGSPGKAEDAVNGWAAEVACYTFGNFTTTDQCDKTCAAGLGSMGDFPCGHYTQVVWRNTTELGCGVATCGSGFNMREYWVCNYNPPGNYTTRAPY